MERYRVVGGLCHQNEGLLRHFVEAAESKVELNKALKKIKYLKQQKASLASECKSTRAMHDAIKEQLKKSQTMMSTTTPPPQTMLEGILQSGKNSPGRRGAKRRIQQKPVKYSMATYKSKIHRNIEQTSHSKTHGL